MSSAAHFQVRDRLEAWYEDIFDHHYEQATERVEQLLAEAEADENGCIVTRTVQPRKVRFHGGQDRAYRFIYCVRNRLA
ncbi:hypothetical protein ACGYLM_19510, partial [Sulfitobacter sp. 1A10445]|uniref:hypothetical protein n=1 Tax=unclassified Sulfitobacter TaxID=196795 RepID=UPI003745C44C